MRLGLFVPLLGDPAGLRDGFVTLLPVAASLGRAPVSR
jgi:hypothetical protein